MIKSALRVFCLFTGVVFVLPLLAALAWWSFNDHPVNWRAADWNATGLLAETQRSDEAAIFILGARTGGIKGAVSMHSWVVIKPPGRANLVRYDKVGWGTPVRKNAYPADANWYSNPPAVIKAVTGERAEQLIAPLEAAIASYPFSQRGDYRIWPGPNSNSFVAHLMREVPALGAALPAHAVGKDYLGDGRWFALDHEGYNLQVNIAGYIGFALGLRSGVEVQLLGQTAGIDITRPALKIPGFGRLGMGR